MYVCVCVCVCVCPDFLGVCNSSVFMFVCQPKRSTDEDLPEQNTRSVVIEQMDISTRDDNRQ